jgi:hypothetical protein
MVGWRKNTQPTSGELLLVPANEIVAFLATRRMSGSRIFDVECLYKWASGGTRPSMELSATTYDIPEWSDFMAFVIEAAAKAQAVADEEGAAAFFEVWVE